MREVQFDRKRDPSQWQVKGWFYKNEFYATTDEFHEAYESPDFEKLGVNREGDWARIKHQGPSPNMDDISPPTVVHPGGKARISIDLEQLYVE